ncbi:MAG: choice-of-anchor D domain-containing protein [Spirochaetales bacterium]|nr:choice-of-anchor D domain-containing protein [Spirochaetales bacterium]
MNIQKRIVTVLMTVAFILLFSGCNLFIEMFEGMRDPADDTPPVPARIGIFYREVPILNGLDSFDFGSIAAGDGKYIEFTIRNLGETRLVLEGQPLIVNTSGENFSLQTNAALAIEAGEETAFTIYFTSEGDDAGEYRASVTIKSNDSIRNPFTFYITGSIVQSHPAEPDIDVYYQNINIKPGDTSVDLGTVRIDQIRQYVFHMTNMGDAEFTLSGIEITGDGFELLPYEIESIAVSDSVNFKVSFTSSESGSHSGTILIDSKDPYDYLFGFNVMVLVE